MFVTATQKAARRISPDQTLRYLDEIAGHPVFAIDYTAVRAAAQLSATHSFSFWDALIVVAASRSRAARLYTEDLQHGRVILGVEIVNPFREAPGR